MMSESESDLGGYKEVIVRIAGQGAYSRLKFESGGHRVQRVPATETQGRIHTSACTVAVMPEADEISEVVINPADLRIDTFRASGAGGQHINKTDSAVRVTHLPTGIVVECQDDRSQHKNKDRALKVLAARIKDKQSHEQHAKEAATRKSLIGSGDRSERIRTYNFPQGRMTDHRINLTLYKLDAIMDGDLDELIGALVERASGRVAGGARGCGVTTVADTAARVAARRAGNADSADTRARLAAHGTDHARSRTARRDRDRAISGAGSAPRERRAHRATGRVARVFRARLRSDARRADSATGNRTAGGNRARPAGRR